MYEFIESKNEWKMYTLFDNKLKNRKTWKCLSMFLAAPNHPLDLPASTRERIISPLSKQTKDFHSLF